MNIKMWFAALSAIVVMIITGCSDSLVPVNPNPVPTASATSQPSIAVQSPAGYDEWALSTTDDTSPEMAAMARMFGLAKIVTPNSKRFSEGFVGYSQLEDYCIVGFLMIGANPDEGTISVTVMSRYNQSLTMVSGNVPVGDIRALLDDMRPICSGDKPILAEPTQATA